MAVLKIIICWSELFPLFCASLGGSSEIMSIGTSECQSGGWAMVQWKSRCEEDEGLTGDFHPPKGVCFGFNNK